MRKTKPNQRNISLVYFNTQYWTGRTGLTKVKDASGSQVESLGKITLSEVDFKAEELGITVLNGGLSLKALCEREIFRSILWQQNTESNMGLDSYGQFIFRHSGHSA